MLAGDQVRHSLVTVSTFLGAFVALGLADVRNGLTSLPRWLRAVIGFIWVMLPAVSWTLRHPTSLPRLGWVVALASVVFWFAVFRPCQSRVLAWPDVVGIGWVALPVIVGWTDHLPGLTGFLGRMASAVAGSWAFLVVRGVEGDGFAWAWRRESFRDAVVGFCGFAAVGVPLGLYLDFIRWNPQWPGAQRLLLSLAFTYFVIALPEELLFRGILENLLQARLGILLARLCASGCFGISHVVHPPAPNWDYVLLAAIAGWSYGWVWGRTGSVPAAALTHMWVDVVWGLCWSG